jgi:hypothetical protein
MGWQSHLILEFTRDTMYSAVVLVMVLSPSTLCLESDDEKLGMVADWQPLGLLCFWQSSDFVPLAITPPTPRVYQ